MEKIQLATIISSLPYHVLRYDLHVQRYPPPKLSFEGFSWRNVCYMYVLDVEICYHFPSPQYADIFCIVQNLEGVTEVFIPALEISENIFDLYL